jgi:DNA-binding transcriptional LysR family regulator
MELREMRVFVAIVEEGSLSGAARRLRLSQPAVSQVAAALEREFRTPLLIRASTGVRPTPTGEVLAREAGTILARYQQAMARMNRDLDTDTVLLLGVPLEVPMELLTGPLAEMAETCPHTRVEVHHLATSAQVAALHDGKLDLGLLRERSGDETLDALQVNAEPLGVLLARHVADEVAGPDGVRLDSLAALKWLSFPRSESPAWFDEIVAVLRSHGLRPGRVPTPGQSLIPEVKFASVLAGGVFALAPPGWSQPVPDGVVWQPLVGNPLIRRTWATWRADSRRRELGLVVSALDRSAPSETYGDHKQI